MADPFLDFYSRKDVQLRILEVAEDREVAPRYNQGFGKRPDVLEFPADVLEMAKKGATSFHVSEERWNNPLSLKPGMAKSMLDENRKGWDLILDIDTPHWEYAKWTTYYLIEALKFHDVKNVSLKFSGNKGFHIAVPFESFPDEVNGIKTKNLFPEGLRVMAAYLESMITEMLRNKMLEGTNIQEICQKTKLKRDEIMKDGKLNPFVLVDIDTVLISNRHLFRSPYSMHEKSKLVSIPIPINHVLNFDKREAAPDKVKTDMVFLERSKIKESDAKGLIIQAFDWWGKKNAKQGPDVVREEKSFELPKFAIKEDHFPGCIYQLLKGEMEDGRKRAVFILVNFLKHMGWPWADVEAKVREWNKMNKEPLSESYLTGQLIWHKKQKQNILPPNCSNKAYYQDLRICGNSNVCRRYKNPVNFAQRKAKESEKKRKKKAVKKSTKKLKKKST